MENDAYTHYSLFLDHVAQADYASIPDGGLPKLLKEMADRESQKDGKRTHCRWPETCLHPDGDQISFKLGDQALIVYTRRGAQINLNDCLAEGNEPTVGDKSLIA